MQKFVNILIGGDFCPRSEAVLNDPFSGDLVNLMQNSDYCMINLETPLTHRGKPILKTGRNFKSNPHYARILKQSGVDCVCLANNHIRDFGDEGVSDTVRFCREAGLDVVGAGKDSSDAAKPLIKDISLHKVAFLNYCEREFSIAEPNRSGANPFDPIDAYHTIINLKHIVDKIIVIYHGGLEYQYYPTPIMVKYFRFLVDIGVDAVIAHHSHTYSGYERYKGKVILYGLGNLLSYTSLKSPRDSWFSGLFAKISLGIDDVESSLNPISINKDMSSVNMPSRYEQDRILRHIDVLCEDIGSSTFTEYWINMYLMLKDVTLNDITVTSKFHRKLNRLLGINWRYISKYQTLSWLNYCRCESHREKLIANLEAQLQLFEE